VLAGLGRHLGSRDPRLRTRRVTGGTGAPAGPALLPLELDGERHSLSLPLEPIASRAPAGGGYTLQITASSTVYDLQRAASVIDFDDVRVALRIAKPKR
jgi:hypothetical protein